MEENLNKDLEIKEKLANLVKNNKKKTDNIYSFFNNTYFLFSNIEYFPRKKK